MNYSKCKIITKDGSSTFRIDRLKESYHSIHGAVTESNFIYVNEGFNFWNLQNPNKTCRILELGYGTGLMTYLTLLEASKKRKKVVFTSLEAFPLTNVEIEILGYNNLFQDSNTTIDFNTFSQLSWDKLVLPTNFFKLTKKQIRFEDFNSQTSFDLIYYDAFGAHAQPELWNYECMKKCFDLLSNKGVWVSYCAKGSVRRGLNEAGFSTQRLPGPPGKREMLRAIKS